MKRFLLAWCGLFAVFMTCLALALPLAWFIKWQPPMLSDIMDIGVLRIAAHMLFTSMICALLLSKVD